MGFPVLNQSLLRNAYKIQATASKDTCCLGDTINVYGYGAEADRFRWDPNPYLLENNLGTVRAIPLQNTSFSVKGWSMYDSGTASTSVVVIPKPQTPSIRWNGADSLFVNNPIPATKYYWYKNDILIRTTDLPSIKADSGFVYKVRSVGTGCLSDASNLVVTTISKRVPMVSLLRMGPNPVSDKLSIKSLSDEDLAINLVNLQGKLVSQLHLGALLSTELNTSALVPGVYHVQVVTQSGRQSTMKLVKE